MNNKLRAERKLLNHAWITHTRHLLTLIAMKRWKTAFTREFPHGKTSKWFKHMFSTIFIHKKRKCCLFVFVYENFPLSQTFSLSHFSVYEGNEDLTKNHKQEPKLNFLIKAIYTLAYGLQSYHDDVCGKDFIGVCPQLQKSFNHSKFFVSFSMEFSMSIVPQFMNEKLYIFRIFY